MNLNHATAFDPFLDTWLSVTCKRPLTGGQTATFEGRVMAGVVVGSTPGDGGANLHRLTGDQYTVLTPVEGFPAEDGPKHGDQMEHEIYGTLTVQQPYRNGDHYEINCIGKGTRRP